MSVSGLNPYRTQLKKLKEDLQKDFIDLFRIESTITFKCYRNHKSQIKEVNQMLLLPIKDEKENFRNSLNDILQNYFQEHRIERNCHTCDSVSALKSQKITTYPQVLILQYKRFTREEYKISDQIICGTSLKLGNATYKLTGIVVHVGSSITAGHYYAVTCCWKTGKAYKLNDAEFPKTLQDNELDEEIKNAYMLVFSITNEEADVLSYMTIEDPISPARKKNRQEEESMQSGDEDLPTPEYVPVRGRQRDPDESTSIDEIGHILTSEESNFIELVKEIEKVASIPPKERTEDEEKKLRNMKSKYKKLEKISNTLIHF